LSAGYLRNFSQRNEFVTGFSDTVQLGAIGRIKQSDQVVMHVQIENDHGGLASLKGRGIALANFDGRTWRNPAETMEPLTSWGRPGANCFDLLRTETVAGNLITSDDTLRSSRRLRYTITMEPIGTNVLFLASVPISVYGKMRE